MNVSLGANDTTNEFIQHQWNPHMQISASMQKLRNCDVKSSKKIALVATCVKSLGFGLQVCSTTRTNCDKLGAPRPGELVVSNDSLRSYLTDSESIGLELNRRNVQELYAQDLVKDTFYTASKDSFITTF